MRAIRLIFIAAVLTSALSAGAAVAAPAAAQRTRARLYQAFESSGAPKIHITKTVKGYCFTGSLEADRNNAWRCASGNFLYDPCFSSRKAKGVVLCPTAAWKTSGIEIKLTKAFPSIHDTKPPSTKGQPWAIETVAGLKCVGEGMGPFINSRVYGDYVCNNHEWLWDQPRRNTEPWTIYIAPVTAKQLTQKAKIKIAWF